MTTPASRPESPETSYRTFVIEGDAKMLERQNKQSDILGFRIMCDEAPPMGDNTAPPPLAYFASSLLF